MTKTAIIGLAFVSLFLAAAPGWTATLESPANGASLSGIGFISGWKCDAGEITVTINDGGHIPVATDQPRADTRIVCGTIHNGFITQMNWALLGTGTHTVVAYDDGVKFASSVFTVVTTGEEYLSDAAGECVVPDFPAPGENASFAWNTSTQHLELTDVGSHVVAPNPATTGLERFVGLWETTYRHTFEGCTHHPPFGNTWPFTVNTATEFDTTSGLSIVLPSGYIEGSFPTEPEGERTFSISGRFTDTTGAGTWFNNFGCGGTWTARKISENPNSVPPEPEPDPIHGQCGSTRNTCRAGTPNDSAVADTDTHYWWICTGQHGGMSSGTCQAAKPPPPPNPAAPVRRILGTWRFTLTGLSGWDEWTLSEVQHDDPPGAARRYIAVGQTHDGYHVVGGEFSKWYPAIQARHRYFVFWEDDFGVSGVADGLCHLYVFDLTSATTAEGEYWSSLKRNGTCETANFTDITTGRRRRAHQGQLAPLRMDQPDADTLFGTLPEMMLEDLPQE